jgi:hypothetical protein
MPNPSDWIVFRKYAQRVRVISILPYHRETPLLNADVFSMVRQSDPDQLPLLPNLRTLVWLRADDLDNALLFMHESVTHARLAIPARQYDLDMGFIHSVCRHMYHLHILEIQPSMVSHSMAAESCYALNHLLELHTFTIINWILEPSVIDALAVAHQDH